MPTAHNVHINTGDLKLGRCMQSRQCGAVCVGPYNGGSASLEKGKARGNKQIKLKMNG